MSNKREALEAALSALESERIMAQDGQGNYTVEATPKRILDAIEKVKGALAEPEQEPVARQFKDLKTGDWCNFIDERHYRNTLESGLFEIRSLYTSPQPREWQELSEKEIISAISIDQSYNWPYKADENTPSRIAKRIYTALRAKNRGSA